MHSVKANFPHANTFISKLLLKSPHFQIREVKVWCIGTTWFLCHLLSPAPSALLLWIGVEGKFLSKWRGEGDGA